MNIDSFFMMKGRALVTYAHSFLTESASSEGNEIFGIFFPRRALRESK